MHDLDTIKRRNNESGEHLTGKAQTLAEIQAGAARERLETMGTRKYKDWPESRNEH